MDRDILMKRAIAAWSRYRGPNNLHLQPSAGLSEVVGNIITLSNVNGVLVRYRWTGDRLVNLGNAA